MDEEIDYPFPASILEEQSELYNMLNDYFQRSFPEMIDHPLARIPEDYPEISLSGDELERWQLENRLLMKNRFWSEAPPSFGFVEYLARIRSTMPKLETTVLLALPIYASRLEGAWGACLREGRYPPNGLLLGQNLVHRFTITAICLASKALGDQFYSNKFCSVVGGITTRELHGLELELAARLSWNLQCSDAEYAWSWAELNKR